MAEIGSGNGTSWPTALDVNSIPEVNSPAAGKTKARKEVVEDLTAICLKVEEILGTSPQGSLTDVKTFLQTHHQTDGTHKSTHGPHKWLDEQDYTNFTTAIAAAPNKTLVIARSINLDANTIIPASVSLMPLNPGVINANGFTLTINGPVVGNPMHQWLSGFAAGGTDIIFGKNTVKEVVIQWLGALGGTNNDSTVLNVALATGQTVLVPYRSDGYTFSSLITMGKMRVDGSMTLNFNGGISISSNNIIDAVGATFDFSAGANNLVCIDMAQGVTGVSYVDINIGRLVGKGITSTQIAINVEKSTYCNINIKQIDAFDYGLKQESGQWVNACKFQFNALGTCNVGFYVGTTFQDNHVDAYLQDITTGISFDGNCQSFWHLRFDNVTTYMTNRTAGSEFGYLSVSSWDIVTQTFIATDPVNMIGTISYGTAPLTQIGKYKIMWNNGTAQNKVGWIQGDVMWKTLPDAGNSPGWICTKRVDTTIRVQATSGATTIEVTSTTDMLAGDVIGIVLDNAALHWTTVASITDADTLVITAGIPTGRTANVGAAVYTNRWKGMANLP